MPVDWDDGNECDYDCEHCPYYHDPCFWDLFGDEDEDE